MTDLELKEYLFDTNQQLLDEDVSVNDLMRHNNSMDHLRDREQDETIDKMVRGLYDKTDIDIDLTGKFDFALRGYGRIYPPELKKEAVERLMQKYE